VEAFDLDLDAMAPPTPPPTAIAMMTTRTTTTMMKNILRFSPNILFSSVSEAGFAALMVGEPEGMESSGRKTLGASSKITGYFGS